LQCIYICMYVYIYISLSIYLSIYLPIYSCCSHLEHRASVTRFVSFQFLNLRQSVGLPGRGISPSQGRYLHKTTQTQKRQTNIHALSGIRTHYPSVRAGDNISYLTPRGHCDRHIYKTKIYKFCLKHFSTWWIVNEMKLKNSNCSIFYVVIGKCIL
jgi:hypothetical protein